MSWFIVMILIIYAVKGDRKNLFTGKQFNTLKKWIIGIFLVSLFSSFIPGLLVMSMVFSPVILPIILIILAVNKSKKKKTQADEYKGSYNQQNDASGSYYDYGSTPKRGAPIFFPRKLPSVERLLRSLTKNMNYI